MDYQQTLDWLYSKLPMFQRVGSQAYKVDLTNIQFLTNTLGNPQNKYPTVHVAGTNGKGSTSHMLASILQEAGYKVGLTTSPHLKDFRERIRVNGQMCSQQFVIDFIQKNKSTIESLSASFFEVSIAMAFEYFALENVDIAIVETGLGGRLDSTNIIHPILSIITNIGLDHTAILGNSIQEIAQEKAGIIKPQTPIIIGESLPETQQIFIDNANKMNAQIIFAEKVHFTDIESDLKGNYQFKNKRTVSVAIQKLQDLGWNISEDSIKIGFLNVKLNTGFRGRWEVLGKSPLIVADTAHNAHGLSQVIQQIEQLSFEKIHLVLGFVNDKDVESIIDFFPKDGIYYFTQPDVPRKLTLDKIKEIVSPSLNAYYFDTVNEAIKTAKINASSRDFIYIGGSTFIVAEAI